MSPSGRHRLVSDVYHGLCTSVAHSWHKFMPGSGMGNSPVTVHDDSCVVVHDNSSGANT